MDNSFFSGSENLYKYLVSIGLLLVVLTVYYPLREKQELEILTIQLESALKALDYKITSNQKSVSSLKVNANGGVIDKQLLNELDKLNQENNLSQIETEKKYSEIQFRRKYINLYGLMCWFFIPIGTIIMIFGFVKWKTAKETDDKILNAQSEKLNLEVEKLKKEIKNIT
jgi:hypothetical protein